MNSPTGVLRALVWLSLCAISLPAVGDELLSGVEFRRAIGEPIGPIAWSEKPLRGALERLTETQHIAIWLDRRIDPDQMVNFSATSFVLKNFVAALAEKYGGSSCQVGPVLYVGPAATTSVLPTVVAQRQEQAGKLGGAAKGRLLRASTWNWPRLTTPRTLLDELERDYSVQIQGKENVPHDLWSAVQLPPLNFIEKLSLVLAGFHVSFELSAAGDAVKLVAMPADASLTRSYTLRGDATSLAAHFQGRFPQAEIRADGKQLFVNGRWEVHDAVERLLAGESTRTTTRPPAGKQTFTLQVENQPVGGVLRAIGKQLGKTVTLDDVKVQRRLTEEISFEVKDASLNELLRRVVEPANLKFEIDGEVIRVFD